MYDFAGMKNRKVKMFFGVFGALAIGTFVPILAVGYQLKKTSLWAVAWRKQHYVWKRLLSKFFEIVAGKGQLRERAAHGNVLP